MPQADGSIREFPLIPLPDRSLAEGKQNQLFPTALLSSDLDSSIWTTLKNRGFTPENTLFGHSICAGKCFEWIFVTPSKLSIHPPKMR